MAEQPPWRSVKVWYTVIGVGLLLALALTGTIALEGFEVTGIVMALIVGRAWEGAAARRVE